MIRLYKLIGHDAWVLFRGEGRNTECLQYGEVELIDDVDLRYLLHAGATILGKFWERVSVEKLRDLQRKDILEEIVPLSEEELDVNTFAEQLRADCEGKDFADEILQLYESVDLSVD